jgi:hypothetical protein
MSVRFDAHFLALDPCVATPPGGQAKRTGFRIKR